MMVLVLIREGVGGRNRRAGTSGSKEGGKSVQEAGEERAGSRQPRSQGLSSSRPLEHSRGREEERPWERGWEAGFPRWKPGRT